MFSWANVALAVLGFLSSLFQWFREESSKEAGKAIEQAKVQEAELNAIQEAKKAGDDARYRIDAVPESNSLPDDGFRRD